MSLRHAAALGLLALALAGCRSVTTSTYRLGPAPGHRERIERLLARYARDVDLSPVPVIEGQEVPNRFAAYYDPFTHGLTLLAYERTDSFETLLSEKRDFGLRPTRTFDNLEQKLRHEFATAFGSEVDFHTRTFRLQR